MIEIELSDKEKDRRERKKCKVFVLPLIGAKA
jgi:hypothetical protein